MSNNHADVDDAKANDNKELTVILTYESIALTSLSIKT